MKRVKLSVFAKEQGISYITAYRHWQQGHIDGVQLPTGSILVSGWKDGALPEIEELNAVIYARVTNPGHKKELKAQVEQLTTYAANKNYNVIEIVEEVATGFSDHRTKLLSLLYRPDWDILIVERRDTLMKFGYPYIEALLRKNHQEIIVLSEVEDTETNENKQDDLNTITLAGEQNLITLIQRVRGMMKPLMGIGSVKTVIEEKIQSLLD